MSDDPGTVRRATATLLAAGGLDAGLVGVQRTLTVAFAWPAAEVARLVTLTTAVVGAVWLRRRGVGVAQLWGFGLVSMATFLPLFVLAGGGPTAGGVSPTLRAAAFAVASLAAGYTYLAVGGLRGVVRLVAGRSAARGERRTE